jgi:hypothetical protein
MMNSRELMLAAMQRQPTERIPTMPQICHDLPVRLYAGEFAADWIDGMGCCAAEPALIYDLVIRIVRETGCDGLRLFVKPDPMRVVRSGDEVIVLDSQTGDRIGRLDTHGGGALVPDRPEPPAETLEEYGQRVAALRQEFSDEKMELLRHARQRVPDLFVAGSPGGMTMNIYTSLRGRQQAMIDLCDRPDFVSAAMDMHLDVMIERGEKLVQAGVDCLYIGDPAASASLISPKHFAKFCLPVYQQFCRQLKKTGVLIYIHVCGNSRPILEMLADTGADVVEPLDPLGGVSVADAKRRIGRRVALMGGVNTVTLAQGTPEAVGAEAIQKCREGGPYGYILAAGDMVPPDTSRANLQALVNVATQSLWR